jgi:hypothetical protein
MTDGFRTDNELLARRAEAFEGLSERAGLIAGDLSTEVAGYGRCWGDDEVGRAFAEGHVRAAEAALAGLGALPGGLADVGSRLIETAVTYARSDHTGETAIHEAGQQQG